MRKLLFLLILVLAFSGEAHAAPCTGTSYGIYTCVQQCAVEANATTVNCAFGSNVTNGNFVIVWDDTYTGTISSFGLGSCSPLPSTTQPDIPVSGGVNSTESYAVGVATSTGSCTIGCTVTATTANTCIALEISGGNASGTLDGHGMLFTSSVTAGNPINAYAPTTSTDGDLIIAFFTNTNGTGGAFTVGSGFTIVATQSGFASMGELGVQATHGSITPTSTQTQSTVYATATIALEPPPSGPRGAGIGGNAGMGGKAGIGD